ncbi:MAG: penicillin-binding protein 2 [Candidatus Doudnabacteria bacterium]
MNKAVKANPPPSKNSYNLRIFLLMLLLTSFIGVIGIRLFNLQILDHSYYKALASNQHGLETTIDPQRGQIYLQPVNPDSQPLLVATNLSKNMVFAIPKQIPDKAAAAAKLARLLDMSVSDLQARISGPSYVALKKQLTDDVSAKIKALKIPGIYLEAQNIRFYPEDNLASQVLGFLGFKGDQRVGQYGIEGKFEKNLAGDKGSLGTDTDQTGSWISLSGRNLVPATDGDDIYLTIDPTIQYKAQQVLADTVKAHQADGGSVVILNPKTGAVLAMTSFPDFDPNNYGNVTDPSAFSNQVLTEPYEPGSVFKGITMAAAIDTGKVTPDTTFENTGSVQVDDKLIKNSDPTLFLGTQNMITVLDESLNTGAYFAEQQIGNDVFKNYVEKMGFGKPTGFELPEVAGNLKNLEQKGNVFFATASFGQGITVTPLELAQAYSALANGGKMAKPYIVAKIVHPDGSQDVTKPADPVEVISPKTASTVSAMLVDVVENGHGKKAAVKGYYIAGKTGTAQVPLVGKSGYDPNKNIGSFIGFGPVDNPQFVMLVRIDNPKDVKFAETTAAPAFGEIASFILNYLQIPPSRQ